MTRIKTLLQSVLILGLMSLLTACPSSVSITSPANNSVSNTAPEFRIHFANGVPASFSADINGVAIDQSAFTVDGNDAYMAVDMASLHAGDNVFEVTDPVQVKSTFYLDQEGPVIHLLSATGTDPRTVTGYLSDRGGPASISINGTNLPLDANHHFSADIPAADTYAIEAQDVYGNTTSQSYAKLGTQFNPAFAVRINQQGLAQSLPDAIMQIVNSINFNDYITNPVSQSCSNAVIADACGEFNINDVSLTPGSTVAVTAQSGNVLHLKIHLSRLDLNTTATTYAKCKSILCGGSGTIFGTLNFSGITTVQNTDISGDFQITVNNGQVSVNVLPGSLDVNLPLNGLQVNIDFGAVGNVPFVGDLLKTVVNGIINGLVGVFSSIVMDIADHFLSQPVSTLINTLITHFLPDSVSVPVANTTLNLGFSPQTFATSNGGFDLALASDVTLAAVDPNVLPPLGSRYVSGSAPNPYPTTTPDGTATDLTATLSANLLNQVLTEAYKGGLLDMTLDETNGFTVGNLASIPNFPLNLTGVTNLTMTVQGATPPEVTVVPQADAANGVVALQLLDLTLKLNVDFGDGKGLQQVLATTVDLRTPFDLGITSDNKLTVGIEATPDVNVQNFQLNAGGIVISSGNSSFIKDLINSLAPQLLPKILSSVGGIPIPSIAGFSLDLKGIWNPSADNNAFLSLAGNLVSTATTATAEAPVITAQTATTSAALSTTTGTDQRNATIWLDGYNPGTAPLEYRYRINGGYWTVWKPRKQINLTYLPAGDNKVDICGRTDALKEDCTQVVVPVAAAQ